MVWVSIWKSVLRLYARMPSFSENFATAKCAQGAWDEITTTVGGFPHGLSLAKVVVAEEYYRRPKFEILVTRLVVAVEASTSRDDDVENHQQ